jgi:hypothetical protein
MTLAKDTLLWVIFVVNTLATAWTVIVAAGLVGLAVWSAFPR